MNPCEIGKEVRIKQLLGRDEAFGFKEGQIITVDDFYPPTAHYLHPGFLTKQGPTQRVFYWKQVEPVEKTKRSIISAFRERWQGGR